MLKFEVGKTYMTRSICDYDCKIFVTVAKRTAHTLTSTEGKLFRIKPNWRGEAEMIYPWGSGFSMCPIMTAEDLKEKEAA